MISAIRFPPLTWSEQEPGWILRDKNRGIRSINQSPLWAEGENLKGPRWETLLGLRNHHDIVLTGRTSVVLDRFVSTVCCPPVVTCCHCRHPVNHRTWNGVWCGSAQVQRWLGFITGPREAEPTHEARSGILVCIYLIEPVQVIPHDRKHLTCS